MLKEGFEDKNFKTLYDFRSRFANFFERKWNRDIQGKERICVEPLAKEFQPDYKEFKQVEGDQVVSGDIVRFRFVILERAIFARLLNILRNSSLLS